MKYCNLERMGGIVMSEQNSGRKFGWIDKWVKMTGERALIDAKANNTYIVYKKDGVWVKHYPNGEIVPDK